MPRGQKSKLRARKKRQQAPDETKGLRDAQGIAAEKEDSPSSTSPHLGDSSQNLPTARTGSTPKLPERAAGASGTDSVKSAKGRIQEDPSFSQAIASLEEDPLDEHVILLLKFLLQKYYDKELVTKADMVKSVNKRYESHFPEIFKRAFEHMELVFGVNLKEVFSSRHCYTFFSTLDLTADNMFMNEENMPKTGILMLVLSVILTNSNCATEEEVWEVLNVMGIYAGIHHFIYGEPKKAITQELVQIQYLEYQQVPNSDPPRYEFLWGPRVHAETTKMKVLEFMAKLNGTSPSAFPSLYEEALNDKEERI